MCGLMNTWDAVAEYPSHTHRKAQMNSVPSRPDLTESFCTFGFLSVRDKVCGCEIMDRNRGPLPPKMNSLIGTGLVAWFGWLVWFGLVL